jgi:uncharacterized damage-inducible protein DinB
MQRTDTPSTWDERATLLTMLQYTRDTAVEKCRDLASEQAGSAPVASSPLTTVGGVVNHLRWVEHAWVENRFVGGPYRGPSTDGSPDQAWVDGAAAAIVDVVDAYREQARRTDAIIAAHELDDCSATPLSSGVPPTLRWVVLHLIEETARHNGHLDILRELADGVRGD